MYLILKPLTVTKVFNERVENYCSSNEFIRLDVITGGQNFFVNDTGLLSHGNRYFDKEWEKNKELECYAGEVIIYRRSKVKDDDLLNQKIVDNTIGKIQDLEKTLYFEIFLDDDSFNGIYSELIINTVDTRNIGIHFKNPLDESENKIFYQEFSEYSNSNRHIKWEITNKERHNYLAITEVNFSFKKVDVEEKFYDSFTKAEREQNEKEKENNRVEQIVATALDNSNLNKQIVKLNAQVNEIQTGFLGGIKKQLFVLTVCIAVATIKYVF